MPKTKNAAKQAKKKILIVEDDLLFAGIYTDKFTQEGFEVALAVNGEAGLAKIRSERPDIVLMDLVLPKLSGLQVLEEIKNEPDEALRSIPILVVTNLSQESDMQKASALGAKAYFVKSNTLFSDVLAEVRNTLGIS